MKVQVTIESLDNQGRGLTHLSGKVLFVTNALPKEIVDVEIIKETSKYMLGERVNLICPSDERVTPKCPYYDSCGGCSIAHMNYECKLDFKKRKVEEILSKYAKIDIEPDLILNNRDYEYRNKISLKIENFKWGYYNSNSHEFVEVNDCLLANKSIRDFLSVSSFIKLETGTVTIRSNSNGEVLLVFNSSTSIDIDFNHIPEYIKGIVFNDKTIYGENFFYESILDLKFKISYNSFFQVNNFMNENIMTILKKNLHGKNLRDLYCGVGSLGLSLHNNFENIYGIEIVKNAIKDAEINAKINNISNTHYFSGDSAKILSELDVTFDSIVVDPPRSGLSKKTLDLIMRLKPSSIAYVSCDPITLSRDLSTLKSEYNIKKIYVLDMFPNTYHVECVCILKK